MQIPIMSVDEVAAALGLGVSGFRRRREALHKSGFPRPLPGLIAKWSRAQVTAWIEAGGAPRPLIARNDALEAEREILRRRYAGRAA